MRKLRTTNTNVIIFFLASPIRHCDSRRDGRGTARTRASLWRLEILRCGCVQSAGDLQLLNFETTQLIERGNVAVKKYSDLL